MRESRTAVESLVDVMAARKQEDATNLEAMLEAGKPAGGKMKSLLPRSRLLDFQ
jgi:hypothetical protein